MGLQAAQRVLEASDPLRLLTELAQNFPTHAGPLSRLDVSADLRKELAANRRVMQAGPHSFNMVVGLNESECESMRLDGGSDLRRSLPPTAASCKFTETVDCELS